MSIEVLFVGDPWDTLDHARDSSLHLIKVAHERHGVRAFWAHAEQIYLRDGRIRVRVAGEVKNDTLVPAPDDREFASFHSVHWRADPPVTLATFRLWSLLASCGGERGVPFVNAPHALLTWNEKFAPLRFPEWAIPGIVADNEEAWESYFRSHPGKSIVAKPTGDAASRGVRILPQSWNEAKPLLDQMRREHGAWLVLQEFDETLLDTGETRIFILGSRICGAINKRPHPKHRIMNLDVPPEERPQLNMVEPTAVQRARATEIAQSLAQEGVYLATIDFIGDRILEINVTSPGLISWLDEHLPRQESIAVKYWEGLLGSWES